MIVANLFFFFFSLIYDQNIVIIVALARKLYFYTPVYTDYRSRARPIFLVRYPVFDARKSAKQDTNREACC